MTEVWSCGGGTQSGAIAALIAAGKLPRPDYAFMTDTGRERASTWPFDFEAACRLEDEVRIKDPHFYLHPALVPLSQVDFTAQHTMFPDRGCTTGCFT